MKRRRVRLMTAALLLLLGALSVVAAPGPADAQGSPLVAPARVIASGNDHTCGLTATGAVDCWGEDILGSTADQAGPYTLVESGTFHNCALTSAGAAECWGRDSRGETAPQPGPFTDLALGRSGTCGLQPDGDAECWGDATVAGIRPGPFTQLAVVGFTACGLKPDRTIECWGNERSVLDGRPTGTFTQLEGGAFDMCALSTAGNVDCWGYDTVPDQVGPFISFSVTQEHGCGLRADGSVDCWGTNANGKAEDQAGPYVQVETAYHHTCAVTASRTVDCWGWSEFGRLDVPTAFTPDTTVPVITPVVTGTLDPDGWYSTDVNVSFTVTDNESAVSSTGCAPVTVTTDGIRSITCTATSSGGTASATVEIKRDTSAPVVAPSYAGTLGNGGWYVSDVTVSFTVNDPHSPVTSPACGPVTVDADGTVPVTCTATSPGGTTSVSVDVMRDTGQPTLSAVLTPVGPVPQGGSLTVAPLATDPVSGVATATCATPDTSQVGQFSVACQATDTAGNVTSIDVAYTVVPAAPRYACLGVSGTQAELEALGYRVILGTARNDRLNGTSGKDFVLGGTGHDLIVAGDGDDVVCGDDGNDTVLAGRGNDQVDGGAGIDVLTGEQGNDAISGSAGADLCDGGPGTDTATTCEIRLRFP